MFAVREATEKCSRRVLKAAGWYHLAVEMLSWGLLPHEVVFYIKVLDTPLRRATEKEIKHIYIEEMCQFYAEHG